MEEHTAKNWTSIPEWINVSCSYIYISKAACHNQDSANHQKRLCLTKCSASFQANAWRSELRHQRRNQKYFILNPSLNPASHFHNGSTILSRRSLSVQASERYWFCLARRGRIAVHGAAVWQSCENKHENLFVFIIVYLYLLESFFKYICL